MVILSAQLSSLFFTSFTWSIIYILSEPSLYIGSCNDTGSWIASKLNAISSFSTPNSFAISSILGSLPFSLLNLSLNWRALYAKSLTDLLTLIVLLSLKYLLTSPIIIGTAYVLNWTPCDKSKLSIDFIKPIHPIWNKSSAFSPLP